MVHKSNLIPGISKFIDESILSHYPPTSMKRIVMAGAASLYLKQNQTAIDAMINNPIVASLGVVDKDGMIDIDAVRDTLKNEISKVGYMRLTVPIIGDVDFTADDVDTLYNIMVSMNNTAKPVINSVQATAPSSSFSGGVY